MEISVRQADLGLSPQQRSMAVKIIDAVQAQKVRLIRRREKACDVLRFAVIPGGGGSAELKSFMKAKCALMRLGIMTLDPVDDQHQRYVIRDNVLAEHQAALQSA